MLVTGGAGYVGGAVTDLLVARGERVVVLDDLSRGHRGSVHPSALLVTGSVGDRSLVEALVRDEGIGACIHCAGLIVVDESVRDPMRYFEVNVSQTVRLLDSLVACGVEAFVFSSSAAVYGDAAAVPISEDHPVAPTSPYGAAKAMVERVLEDVAGSGRLRSMALRYFNAAGATDRIAERHVPETHLIPRAVAAALGDGGALVVNGVDYPTPDGTPIRDFVHVGDLAAAHLAALDYLSAEGGHRAVNLGNGSGFSVREVVAAVERVSGRSVPWREGPRRAGDPARLVASVALAGRLLDWRPRMPSLDDIVATAWDARARGPGGAATGPG